MRVNLNNTVKFRITEFGKRQIIKFTEKYNFSEEIVKSIKEKWNDKYWVEIQLWEFMNIFGSASYNGSENICIDNEVEIIHQT